jgi:hypothetical protein
MNIGNSMPPEYLALAEERASAECSPHRQPEDFGYDFRTWVSPYTKGAHTCGGLALVLQDWASVEKLTGGPRADIQLYGRLPTLRTNVRLEALLIRIFGTTLSGVYATNAFPFVKQGSMSAPLRQCEVLRSVRQFTYKELRIAEPRIVLALGSVAYKAISYAGIECVRVPHPAARIGTLEVLESHWRAALTLASVPMRSAN